jgi:hypothetical protein
MYGSLRDPADRHIGRSTVDRILRRYRGEQGSDSGARPSLGLPWVRNQADNVSGLAECGLFRPRDLEQIERSNAARLLLRLA